MGDTISGNRLRALREEKRLARLDVQRLTGVSESTLSRAERGGILTRKTAERLAPLLGVSVDDLLGRAGGA